MKNFFLMAALISANFFSSHALAGYDHAGIVSKMWIQNEGMYLEMPGLPAQYCAAVWNGANVFVPKSNENYELYYGLALAAITKGSRLYLGNVSVFNGSTVCDTTKTGYNIVLMAPGT